MMTKPDLLRSILDHLGKRRTVTLFLDYDGTLLPIAPTPDAAVPDNLLIGLLTDLSKNSLLRVIIISGRSLKTLMDLLPIPHIIFAGIYGAEIFINDKIILRGITENLYRGVIEDVQRNWGQLLERRDGFLLEDKGCAIALHARWAKKEDANQVIEAARRKALELVDPKKFRLLDGNRFLEVAPISANKGLAVNWILSNEHYDHDLPVYFGDDNKDQEAFEVIRQWGGFSIGVGNNYPLINADVHLTSPDEVRTWLKAFISIG